MKVATSTERLNELFDSDARNDSAIARELGVSRQSVSSWRSGIRSPKKPMLIKISETYHVSIEWLMGFDVERNANTSQRVRIVPDTELFRKLLLYMTPMDYEVMMDILERTEMKMKSMGEL